MKSIKSVSRFLFVCLLTSAVSVKAQISPGVYHTEQESDGQMIHHEIKLNSNYFVYTSYTTSPPNFIKTVGGFYTVKNDILKVNLEFNSDYETNGATQLALPYAMKGRNLVLQTADELTFELSAKIEQDLDGQWLFATRGPDKGQERRGEENSRKTLKFLMDGHFQWIAYDTKTFKFSGTGGGSFTSKNGVYTETISYFSKDNSRVGASLKFNYRIKNGDWHHTGKNSKGEPMYEIWAKRQ
ncbi:hypothetical protein [uncultured Kriegella sp.]|uniref:hypothetical protein n=1 Tax=uncultured Kriegella sp. TaxID=1798910 RepID=UPI0030DC204B|tara:strand:+ start:134086 stop:134808 length:723 start_codon:yes stop_codon:yes gene_type:complete